MHLSELKGRIITAKLWTPVHEVESDAINQLRMIASLPWIAHLSVMPDVHLGKGATVGSVIAMRGAVSPAAVGVDIGCGMGAIKTNLKASDLPDSLRALRLDIEAAIPVGQNEHADQLKFKGSREQLSLQNDLDQLWNEFKDLAEPAQPHDGKAAKQIGTLGGGNHFIELCLDTGERCTNCDGEGGWINAKGDILLCDPCQGNGKTEPNVWMMLHSGSRYIGNQLAKHHMGLVKKLDHNQELIHLGGATGGKAAMELAAFLAGTPEMAAYKRDLYWAQRYAMLNRRAMFELYKEVMLKHFPQVTFDTPVLCHHNYVSDETHFGEELIVTRKGAISAKAGQLGIIPGSMGAKSFIVEGLGNPDSLTSASHGAGRKMSRSAAKKAFTLEDIAAQTAGVECRKDFDVVDEIPAAYKDIEQVMANQSDLVKVKAQLKQVLCVKG